MCGSLAGKTHLQRESSVHGMAGKMEPHPTPKSKDLFKMRGSFEPAIMQPLSLPIRTHCREGMPNLWKPAGSQGCGGLPVVQPFEPTSKGHMHPIRLPKYGSGLISPGQIRWLLASHSAHSKVQPRWVFQIHAVPTIPLSRACPRVLFSKAETPFQSSGGPGQGLKRMHRLARP